MKTILYPIPVKYFPSVKVKRPFCAKVNYKVNGNNIEILDVCLSPMCLTYIANTEGLVKEMLDNLQKIERNDHIHPTIMSAIAPHI